MSNETDLSSALSETEIAELVRGIDREHIVKLVKREKHLQRRVFAGFRPTHLPWGQVPTRLAQDAAGHPGKSDHLLNLWRISNQDLLDKISGLALENLREGVIELLVRRGLEDQRQILWALRLDERPEVEKALKNGLEKELVEEASGLISQAENTLLTEALEIARGRLAEAEAERDAVQVEVEKLQRLAERRADKAQEWHDACEESIEEQKRLRTDITALEERRQIDQETITKLQRQLAGEQERVQELRRSVRDLRSSLQAQAEDRDLDETLLELEEERQNSARLRLKVESLTHDLREAYDKRDRVREHVESLEQEVERLEHDKEVIVEEKRRLQKRAEGLQAEVKNLRVQRDEQAYERAPAAIPIENLESAWQQTREDVRRHIHNVLSTLKPGHQPQVEIDKNDLWQDWMEQELSLVEKGLAGLNAYPETGKLPNTATFSKAQKLLALRWYLLEYTRQAIQYSEMASFPV